MNQGLLKFLMYSLVISFFKIIRPINISIALVCIFFTVLIINKSLLELELLFSSLSVISFMSMGYILNDHIDKKSDKINHPHRMLPLNKIPSTYIYSSIILYFIIGLYSTFQLNIISIFISLGMALPIIIFYTSFFKRIPLQSKTFCIVFHLDESGNFINYRNADLFLSML